MSPILKSLMWKEVRELKWETAAATVIVLVLPLTLAVRDASFVLVTIIPLVWLYPLAAGVFFGMRAAAGERSNRTASFVAAHPVSHHLLGTTRLVSMFVASFVPLAALFVLALLLGPLAEESSHIAPQVLVVMFLFAALATCFCISLAALAGVGARTEIRAGLWGFAAIVTTLIVCYLVLLVIFGYLQEQHVPPNTFYRILLVSATFFVAVIATVVAASAFIGQYSRALGAADELSFTGWKIALWQPQLVSAPLSALVGKAICEMAWLGLGVLGVSLLLSVAAGIVQVTSENQRLSLLDLTTRVLPHVLLAGGFVLALLIGVGAVIGDVQPGVNTFWRSRPISPRAWYWTKYGVGLAMMFLAVGIPALLFMGGSTGAIAGNRGVLFWLLLWSLTFTFALTATCFVRKPGYAAILAFGGMNVLYALVEGASLALALGEANAAPLWLVVPILGVAFVVSTAVGWWAAVNDVSIA